MIIALINNKGGVGKTTSAVNLAAGMAEKHKKVLLVDLDSQGSASLSLGILRANLGPSLASVLLHGATLASVIRETHIKGLDVVTGEMALASTDLALADTQGRERILASVLAPVRARYDFVVLDCPPSLSLLSVGALVACDQYIIPVVPQYLALEGLVNLTGAVERIRTSMAIGAQLLGLVLTLVDYRTRVASEVGEMIREHYKGDVFKTEIRVNVRLAEAPSFGQTIYEYDGESSGATNYREWTSEILRKCGKT